MPAVDHRGTRVVLACLASFALACGALRPGPRLDLIYNASARHHAPDRNPIIAIPGILGSRLRDTPTGTLAWGAFEPSAADPDNPDGARLIALPIRGEASLRDIRDDVEPNGVLEKVRIRLAGVPLEIQAYAGILATLGAGGYRDEALGLGGEIDYGDDHYTCFQFDYDWRRDNVENARRLHDFIREKREIVRAQYRERFGVDVPDIQFDIAAHSMGGLVTRYFLMYGSQDLPADGSLPELTWEGADYIDRVILVGTPNAGSLEAFMQLVEGRKIGPLLPYYPASLMGTFPSIYQLLPRARHGAVAWDDGQPIDLLDPSTWTSMKWGLASTAQADVLEVLMPDVAEPETRRKVAASFQRRVLDRAKAFHAAMDRPATPPDDVDLILVAGDSEPTPSRVVVDRPTGTLEVVDRGAGDGTVLRSSALLDERIGQTWQPRLVSPIAFDATLFLPETHLGLTRNEIFRDNVLYWLLEKP